MACRAAVAAAEMVAAEPLSEAARERSPRRSRAALSFPDYFLTDDGLPATQA